jgi:hypothetical protein
LESREVQRWRNELLDFVVAGKGSGKEDEERK